MNANVGMIDRVLPVVVGLVLLSFVFVGPKTVWGLVGLMPLLTGLARFCPAYGIAGVSTCDCRPASAGERKE